MGKNLKGEELGRGLSQRKGGSYEGRFMVNGKLTCIYDTDLKKLKKELKIAREEAMLPAEIKYKNYSLDDWFEFWFNTYKKPTIKETSFVPMQSKYKNTFGRLIGKKRIRTITNYQIQQAVNDLIQEGRASSSIRDALGVVTRCLESAKANKIIEVNPCFEICVPWKKEKKEIRFLSKEEEKIFMETAKDSWYYEMYYVMFHTGLRIGEVGGLRWKDVDFTNECFNIENAFSCMYYESEKTEKLVPLKTQNSYRRIPFIGKVKEMLIRQKQKQNELKKYLKKRYRAEGELEDIVFCTTMGSPITRYVAEKEVNKVVAEINAEESFNARKEKRSPKTFDKVYPHAIRHTFCSRCFENEISPKVVQQLMGHAHYSTTIDIYTHITKDRYVDEVSKFKNMEDLY